MIVNGNAWVPSDPASFTFTPAAIKILAISMSPLRESFLCGGMHVRMGLNQRLGDLWISIRNRPHQRRGFGFRRGRVHVRAMCDERLQHLEVGRMRRNHERCSSTDLGGVRIRSRLQQLLDHRQAGVLSRLCEGRDAVVIGRVHFGAGAQQKIHCLEVVPMGGPQKRSGAVGTRCVHIGALLQQSSHQRLILVGGGVHEPQIRLGRDRDTRDCQERGYEDGRLFGHAHFSSRIADAQFRNPRLL
jgi:hypothetical protein